MNKALVFLPLIALLTVAGVIYINNNEHASLMAPAAGSTLTVGEWQSCVNKLPKKSCSDITNSDQRLDCESAETASKKVVTPLGGMRELMVCQQFDSWISMAKLDGPLNQSNYFNTCFSSLEAIRSASTNQYYYTQIYSPKYFTCSK